LWLSYPEMKIFIYTALESHKGPSYISFFFVLTNKIATRALLTIPT